MTRHNPQRRRPWVLLGVLLGLLTAVGAAMLLVGGSEEFDPFLVIALVVSAVLPPLAAGILAREPANRIGLLLLWTGLLAPGTVVMGSAARALVDPATLLSAASGLAVLLAWLENWVWAIAFLPFVLLAPLLFPDGHLPTPRWAPVAWMAALAVVLVSGAFALDSFPSGFPADETFRSWTEGEGHGRGVAEVMAIVGFVLVPPTALASVLSLILRYRRSTGLERTQIRWLAGGTTFGIPLLVAGVFLGSLEVPGSGALLAGLTALVVPTGFLLIVASMAVAIRRHRLYDLDRVVSRTVTYVVLTGLLVGIYAGLVVALSSRIGSGGDPPAWVVAGATVVTASLFNPLRGRVQRTIDRRLYRAAVDARLLVEDLGTHLRDRVDIDKIAQEVTGIITDALAPTTAALWVLGDDDTVVAGAVGEPSTAGGARPAGAAS